MKEEEIRDIVRDMALRARKAARALRRLDAAERNAALVRIADALEAHREEIRQANALDVERAKSEGYPPALVDRLTLTDSRYAEMVRGTRKVATLDDIIGSPIWERSTNDGITIRKVREPIGVIAVVFESRPNVLVDTAALCLKTANAIILRGGKEAVESNKALASCVREALGGDLADAVQFVEVQDHAAVRELVRAEGLIDLAIPRGGEKLIRAVCEAALIPVLKHYKGVCHIYVDDKANLAMALSILDNAKRQRPSACNAVECLLVNETLAPLFLPMVRAWASGSGVTLHEHDEGVEYLSLDLNVATVRDTAEAIDFINTHSSHHSDAIVTDDAARAAIFLRDVDSACVYHNASTRFTDGGCFGMGAEIGISTDKLHARGPMGVEELTTYKYTIEGDGAVRP